MAGKEPESGATVTQLLDQYVPIADWDLSTRVGFEGYIGRTIRPALGHQKVRKVRKDTKTHQDRWLALDPVSCAFIREATEAVGSRLASVGLELARCEVACTDA